MTAQVSAMIAAVAANRASENRRRRVLLQRLQPPLGPGGFMPTPCGRPSFDPTADLDGADAPGVRRP